MKSSSEVTKQDYLKSIILLTIYVILIGVGAFLLLPKYWYLWGLTAAAGLALLVNWHKNETIYRCPNCEHLYEISFLVDLTAAHGIDRQGPWLLLRCPNCRKKVKTQVLKKHKLEDQI
jgi:uncharacterized C2H2 Zn-finger protein